MKKVLSLVSIVLLLSFTACSSGGGSETTDGNVEDDTTSSPTAEVIKVVKSLDLSSSITLLISTVSDQLSSPALVVKKGYSDIGDISSIYQVTDNGSVEEVETVYEEKAAEVGEKQQAPYDIIDINEEYLLARYTDIDEDYARYAYLVNKNSGVLSENIGKVYENQNGKTVQLDKDGNFYFSERTDDEETGLQGSQITKLTLSATSIVKSKHSIESDVDVDPHTWAVDRYGNLAYVGNDKDANYVARYLKITGGLLNLPGNNSAFFYTDYDEEGILYQWSGEANEVDYKLINGTDYSMPNYGTTEPTVLYGEVKFLKDISIALKTSSGESVISNIINPAEEVTNIDVTDLNISSVQFFGASDSHFYVVGQDTVTNNDVLIKADPMNLGGYEILIDGGYDISKMTVTGDGRVNFNGLRLSDAKDIIGQVSSSGNVEVLEYVADDTTISSIEAVK